MVHIYNAQTKNELIKSSHAYTNKTEITIYNCVVSKLSFEHSKTDINM